MTNELEALWEKLVEIRQTEGFVSPSFKEVLGDLNQRLRSASPIRSFLPPFDQANGIKPARDESPFPLLPSNPDEEV